MTAESNPIQGRHYFYYRCRGKRVGVPHGDSSYPSRLVDQIAWEWIKQLLMDPHAIEEGLSAYRLEQEASAAPVAIHINTIDGLLIEKRVTLQRLLDLYLSGEFHKDVLIDKKTDLEKTIAQLENERAGLVARLEGQTISEEQEAELTEFAEKIASGLQSAEANFKTRRSVVEMLQVEATLAHDQGTKTIRIKCILGEEGYYVLSPAIAKFLAANRGL